MNGNQNKSEYDRYKNGYHAGKMTERVDNLEEAVKNLHGAQVRLFGKIDELIPAVAELKVKASIWGAVGGLAGALITVGITVAVWLARS